jgi:hypothetical protein
MQSLFLCDHQWSACRFRKCLALGRLANTQEVSIVYCICMYVGASVCVAVCVFVSVSVCTCVCCACAVRVCVCVCVLLALASVPAIPHGFWRRRHAPKHCRLCLGPAKRGRGQKGRDTRQKQPSEKQISPPQVASASVRLCVPYLHCFAQLLCIVLRVKRGWCHFLR